MPADPNDDALLLRRRIVADPLYDASAALAAERHRVEVEVVELLVADPCHAPAAMEAVGFAPDIIKADDLRLIAQAPWIGRHYTRETIALAAKKALRYYGWWDETDHRPFTRGPLWCD